MTSNSVRDNVCSIEWMTLPAFSANSELIIWTMGFSH